MSGIVIFTLAGLMVLSGIIFLASAITLDRASAVSHRAGDRMLWIMAISGTAMVFLSVLIIILTNVLERS